MFHCPVIVTKNTNLYHLVEEYNAGLVNDTNYEDLLKKLLFVSTNNKELINKYSVGASKISNILSWDKVTRNYIDAIEEIIDK